MATPKDKRRARSESSERGAAPAREGATRAMVVWTLVGTLIGLLGLVAALGYDDLRHERIHSIVPLVNFNGTS